MEVATITEAKNHQKLPPFNTKSLGDMFYYSFQYSQGYEILQQHIYEYIAHSYPKGTFSDAMRVEIAAEDPLRNRFLAKVRQGKSHTHHVSSDTTNSDDRITRKHVFDIMREELSKYQKTFGAPPKPLESILDNFIDCLLEREWKKEYTSDGRPDPTGRRNHKGVSGKYESQFVRHVLLGQHIRGGALYDNLFHDAHERVLTRNWGPNKETRRYACTLIRIHNDRFSEEKVPAKFEKIFCDNT